MPGNVPPTARAVLGWFDVHAYGATGNGATDDTAAIQAAIDACAGAGGGTVYFPAGTYKVNGAARNVSQENSQLVLPRIDISGAGSGVSIRLLGPAAPNPVFWLNAVAMPTGCANIVSNATSGSILAGWSAYTIGGPFTNVNLGIEKLAFHTTPDPSCCGLDLGCVLACHLDDVLVTAGCGSNWHVTSSVQPSHTTSVGVIFPRVNNGASVTVGKLTVTGYYYGFDAAEHLTARDIVCGMCAYAALMRPCPHPIQIVRLGQFFGGGGVVLGSPTSGTWASCRANITQFAVERETTGWASSAGWKDFTDAGDKARGALSWSVVKSGIGASTDFRTSLGGSSVYTFTAMGV